MGRGYEMRAPVPGPVGRARGPGGLAVEDSESGAGNVVPQPPARARVP